LIHLDILHHRFYRWFLGFKFQICSISSIIWNGFGFSLIKYFNCQITKVFSINNYFEDNNFKENYNLCSNNYFKVIDFKHVSSIILKSFPFESFNFFKSFEPFKHLVFKFNIVLLESFTISKLDIIKTSLDWIVKLIKFIILAILNVSHKLVVNIHRNYYGLINLKDWLKMMEIHE